MTKNAVIFAETTVPSPGLPFDDALDDLRVSGSVLLNEAYAPPWAVDIPDQAALRAALKLGPNARVVPFHLVRRGGFELRLPDGGSHAVGTHDVVICPGGGRHRMGVGQTEAVPLDRILAGFRPPSAGAHGTDATELICGVFTLRAAPLNPLLAALPPVLKVSALAIFGPVGSRPTAQ